MQDSFDPYREWLDIQDAGRPPDHYRLLGIKPLESDPQVIAHAADVCMARVRKVRPGVHWADWGRLLDQLVAAKVCLLNPASKSAYDASLSAQAPPEGSAPEASGPPSVFPPTLATPPTVAGPSQHPPAAASGSTGFQPVESAPQARCPGYRQTDANLGTPPSLFGDGQPPSVAPWPQAPAQPAGLTGVPPGPQSRPAMPWEMTPQTPAQPGTPTGMPVDASLNPAASAGAEAPAPQQTPMGTPTPTPGQPIPLVGTPVPSMSPGLATPVEGVSQRDAVFTEATGADPFAGTAGAPGAPGAAGGRRQAGNRMAVAALLVLVFGLGVAFAYVLNRWPEPLALQGPDANRAAPETPAASTDAPQPPEKDKPQPDEPEKDNTSRTRLVPKLQPGNQAAPQPTPGEHTRPQQEPPTDPEPNPPQQGDPQRPPKPQTEAAGPQPDAKKEAAFGQAVSEVRSSMSGRDLSAARRHLDSAALNAQTPAEQARIARLRTMLDHLDEFWNGMRESVAQLDAPSELVLKDTRVAVVENSRNHLMVKAAGTLYNWSIEEIPAPIVMAVVARSFPKDPGAKVLVGTFLAVDPHGDRGYARRLWQEAAREGMDVEQLMPELDTAVQSSPVGETPTVAPPTDKGRLQQAEQFVRETFQRQYAEATTAAKKSALAEELLARAPATDDNPDARFVMFREALDLAVASGEPALAGEAVDQMAKLYTIDAMRMKADALEEVGKTARGPSSQREIALGTLHLFEQAVGSERLDEAGRLATLAAAAARKSRSPTLIKQAAAAAQRVEALRKQGGGGH